MHPHAAIWPPRLPASVANLAGVDVDQPCEVPTLANFTFYQGMDVAAEQLGDAMPDASLQAAADACIAQLGCSGFSYASGTATLKAGRGERYPMEEARPCDGYFWLLGAEAADEANSGSGGELRGSRSGAGVQLGWAQGSARCSHPLLHGATNGAAAHTGIASRTGCRWHACRAGLPGRAQRLYILSRQKQQRGRFGAKRRDCG